MKDTGILQDGTPCASNLVYVVRTKLLSLLQDTGSIYRLNPTYKNDVVHDAQD